LPDPSLDTKGFIHIGTDTDGTTAPDDVGYGAMVRGKSTDFLGRRSLSLPQFNRGDRLQLVGRAGLGKWIDQAK